MSDRPIWTRRVRLAHIVRGPARAVLWALADRADETGETWVSQSTIVNECGFEERAVRDAMHWLEASGYIRVTPRVGTSPVLMLRLDEDGHRLDPGCVRPLTPGATRTPAPHAPPARDAAPPGATRRRSTQ